MFFRSIKDKQIVRDAITDTLRVYIELTFEKEIAMSKEHLYEKYEQGDFLLIRGNLFRIDPLLVDEFVRKTMIENGISVEDLEK